MTKTVVVFLMSTILWAASCKKSQNAVTHCTGVVPWAFDSVMLGPSTINPEYPCSFRDASALLVSCKISGNLKDTTGSVNLYSRNWEDALFAANGVNSDSVAGIVSVNGTIIGYPAKHYDTGNVWNESGSNRWIGTGTAFIPSFIYDMDGAMPQFLDTLPTEVSRSGDLTITFNSSNTLNADSAHFFVYFCGDIRISNLVSAKGGTAIISATSLIHDKNQYLSLSTTPWVTGNKIYYGGFIVIVLFNYTIRSFGGKQYVFVKQRELIGVVKFQ